ncbi:hypothetical protein TKK_0003583 [Trichogramma kaykai]|uniref:G-protein coupled receptors family 2 profile 2 domain-containing protein n=1 Tax=Trichogramma kaykai TaxID=54128 RepID=A0ABD2XPT7_9HYME
MIMNKRLVLLALLMLACDLRLSSADDDDHKQVDIQRCCRENEDFQDPGKNADGLLHCVPSREPFKLDIFSPETANYLPEPPISWRFLENRRPVCADHEQLQYFGSTPYTQYPLMESGVLIIEVGSETSLDPLHYCVGSQKFLACVPRRNESLQAAATMKPKLRKCCGPDATYSRSSCVHVAHEDEVLMVANYIFDMEMYPKVDLISGFPTKCEMGYTIVGDYNATFLQEDGGLRMQGKSIPPEEFCLDVIQQDSEISNDPWKLVKIFGCFQPVERESKVVKQDIRFKLYPVCLIISAIFLAATLVSGWFQSNSHHLLHWRCQTYHVMCLMLGDITMAMIQLGGTSINDEFCRVLATLAHFFFLSTFFWLNTMCFNIWWTFRDLRPTSFAKHQEVRRLKYYAVYAFGCPFLIVAFGAMLDQLSISYDYDFLRPRFGDKQCWFYGNMEILAYFFGPIGLLLMINVLFFLSTAHELTCGLWKGDIIKSTSERAKLGKVCLKLVILMGVPWIFDVISWMAGGPNYFWYVTDLCNAAQGVLIFSVVGCRPQLWAAFKRLFVKKPQTHFSSKVNAMSMTSHGNPSAVDNSATHGASTKVEGIETIC